MVSFTADLNYTLTEVRSYVSTSTDSVESAKLCSRVNFAGSSKFKLFLLCWLFFKKLIHEGKACKLSFLLHASFLYQNIFCYICYFLCHFYHYVIIIIIIILLLPQEYTVRVKPRILLSLDKYHYCTIVVITSSSLLLLYNIIINVTIIIIIIIVIVNAAVVFMCFFLQNEFLKGIIVT